MQFDEVIKYLMQHGLSVIEAVSIAMASGYLTKTLSDAKEELGKSIYQKKFREPSTMLKNFGPMKRILILSRTGSLSRLQDYFCLTVRSFQRIQCNVRVIFLRGGLFLKIISRQEAVKNTMLVME